eukprot:GFYU01016996.1.p1 GENE.GFYU01016996.1~~GFYU01016996.1.p1  ORF type:complete len:344 (-),score=95.65 GFYU01016996.1:348-1379(-)
MSREVLKDFAVDEKPYDAFYDDNGSEFSDDTIDRGPRLTAKQRSLLFAKVKTAEEDTLVRFSNNSKKFPILVNERKALQPNGPPEYTVSLLKNRIKLLTRVDHEFHEGIHIKALKGESHLAYLDKKAKREQAQADEIQNTTAFIAGSRGNLGAIRRQRLENVRQAKQAAIDSKRAIANAKRSTQSFKEDCIAAALASDNEEKRALLESRKSSLENKLKIKQGELAKQHHDAANVIRAQAAENTKSVQQYYASQLDRAKKFRDACRQKEIERQEKQVKDRAAKRELFRVMNLERIRQAEGELMHKNEEAKKLEDRQIEMATSLTSLQEKNRLASESLRQIFLGF